MKLRRGWGFGLLNLIGLGLSQTQIILFLKSWIGWGGVVRGVFGVLGDRGSCGEIIRGVKIFSAN